MSKATPIFCHVSLWDTRQIGRFNILSNRRCHVEGLWFALAGGLVLGLHRMVGRSKAVWKERVSWVTRFSKYGAIRWLQLNRHDCPNVVADVLDDIKQG